MRPLVKGPKPGVLARNEDVWTEEYLQADPSERRSKERWRHAEIKASLRDELGGRCAYCEGYVEDVSFPHVEHMAPKAKFPELAHRWPNLTSACGVCNIGKGEYWDEDAALLNPYEDAVEDHLSFFGDFVDWRAGSSKGEVTVRKLRLNRIDLVASRLRRIEQVRTLVNEWIAAAGGLRDVLAEAIREDLEGGEFGAAVRAYLLYRGFPLYADTDQEEG